MANILEIYNDYKIMPQLQQHQLRVAAVAKQICDSLLVKVDTESVVLACLLHDMGNIIKFDLSIFPGTVEPLGLEYWEGIKQDYIDRFGTDEHQANVSIAKELGASSLVLDCIDSISFEKTVETVKRTRIEPKICDNADLRVAPHGVLSLNGRLEEGNKRYKDNPNKWMTPEQRAKIYRACHQMEDQIFADSKIQPSDITDESIKPIIEQLKTYEI